MTTNIKDKTIAYAAYWRNSLADADLGRGTVRKDELGTYQRVALDEAKTGFLREGTVSAYFSEEPENVDFIEVVYRPVVYSVKSEHGKRATQLPDFVTPLVTYALLSRDGCLFPKPNTVVPRDILQPLEAGSFYIGTMDDLDSFLTKAEVSGITAVDVREGGEVQLDEFGKRWAAYRTDLNNLLQAVCGDFVSGSPKYLLADYGLIQKKDVVNGATQHVVRLYDHMREKRPDSPLFASYAREQTTLTEPGLPASAQFAARLGHSSDKFALATAQRTALAHLLAAKDGEILAVNGPPGTGKTTLLLSVVASLWAQAALDQSEPPVIFAASTNNQAVTNIIDAFGKDFARGDDLLGGRWLPEIDSFGTYFPSQSRESEASEKYQTSTFFEQIETREYVDLAKADFLSHANAAFPDLNALEVAPVVARLHAELKEQAARLQSTEGAWRLLCDAVAQTAAELGETPDTVMSERRLLADRQSAVVQQWKAVKDGLEAYLANEPFLYSVFSWLPPVGVKRLRKAREFLKTVIRDGSHESLGDTPNGIEISIGRRLHASALAHDEAVRAAKRGETALKALSDARASFSASARRMSAAADVELTSLEQCDTVADKSVRFLIFLLTTHYWEGRWLLEMESQMAKILEKKKSRNPGPTTLKPRWRRRMMLAPCAVSTFAMLPSFLQTFVRGDGKYDADYLYNFIDLLIVDEAGQVLPEIAGASFSLARKALVIGDTKQIEPIWSVPRQVDYGNLMNLGLLTGTENSMKYEDLVRTGKTAASGSVMLVAQNATRYHADPELDRGLYLYEHRRCYDEIIEYSNMLCYHGKLLPQRGSAPTIPEGVSGGLPPMAYVHVDGICESLSAGSRRNLLEAETVAAWLAANRKMLETRYGASLNQIVGIVTPFAGQVAAITAACAKVGIEVGRADGQLTAGTVHSLQGAERQIVIFSSVYSKHEDGRFIDKSTSMLNVAVSRAKDSFIVFGDMDVIDAVAVSEPRGLLAQYLFKSPQNALRFEHRQRADLQTRTTVVSQLQDAEAHDSFLLHTLSNVKSTFQIVTPWLRLERTKEIGAFDAMLTAVGRGVDVEVYTDPQLNIGDSGAATKERKLEQLLADARALREAGITVNFVRQVHSKLVIGDDEVYCVGSFNWFGAQRTGQYVRHETSLLYRGSDLTQEILATRKSLLQRRISTPPFSDAHTSKRTGL